MLTPTRRPVVLLRSVWGDIHGCRVAREVEVLALNQQDLLSHRNASCLCLWYTERETVVTIADVLGLSCSHVAHIVQRQALDLVTQRFLELAWWVEVSA